MILNFFNGIFKYLSSLNRNSMKTTPHIELLIQLSRIDGEASHVELDLIREIGASENFSDEEFEKAMEKMDDQSNTGVSSGTDGR